MNIKACSPARPLLTVPNHDNRRVLSPVRRDRRAQLHSGRRKPKDYGSSTTAMINPHTYEAIPVSLSGGSRGRRPPAAESGAAEGFDVSPGAVNGPLRGIESVNGMIQKRSRNIT